MVLLHWPVDRTCISATGDKLKSEADAALQAQMQRQERLAVSSMDAAEATYEGVLTEAKAGIEACKSGDCGCHIALHVMHVERSAYLIFNNYSNQARSCEFLCAAAERLGSSQESSCEALQGSLQAAGLSITAAGAAVQQADQLAAGEHAASWIRTLTCAWTDCLYAGLHAASDIPCALCHQGWLFSMTAARRCSQRAWRS